MSTKPKQPKADKRWGIYNQFGTLLSVEWDRSTLIQDFCRPSRPSWKWHYRRGFRCHRVTVIPGEIDPNGWRPIETAPRDGTIVEVWVEVGNSKQIRRGYFEDDDWWRLNANSTSGVLEPIKIHPKHWRPLEGPKEKK